MQITAGSLSTLAVAFIACISSLYENSVSAAPYYYGGMSGMGMFPGMGMNGMYGMYDPWSMYGMYNGMGYYGYMGPGMGWMWANGEVKDTPDTNFAAKQKDSPELSS